MAKRSFRSRELEPQPAYPTLERFDALLARRGFLALLGAGALGSLVGCGSESGAPPALPARRDLEREDAARDGQMTGMEATIGLPDAPHALLDQRPPPRLDGPHRSVRHDPKARRLPFAPRPRDGGKD